MQNRTIMLKNVAQYQCPGCMHGSSPTTCEKANVTAAGCTSHYAGTLLFGRGALALGLPAGFNRFGSSDNRKVEVFESFETMLGLNPNMATVYSLPVWKYLDKHGNTLTRWYSPRTNYGWTSVILGDCRDKLPQATELTQADVDYMN
jgi:hypothetical protein